MIVRVGLLAVSLLVGAASVSLAQPKEPLPRAVADIRVSSAGLPTGLGWTPAVPEGTLIPGRGLGFEAGAHVYLAQFPFGALGVGATFLRARGRASPPETTSSSTTLTAIPELRTSLTSLIPQVSLNFGHRLGWSYISGGLGRTTVTSEVAEPLAGTTIAPAESPWVRTINYGGGARWFVNDHVAFSVDLRWFKLAAVDASAARVALPRQSLITASAGISIK
jgi:hypothetical protein